MHIIATSKGKGKSRENNKWRKYVTRPLVMSLHEQSLAVRHLGESVEFLSRHLQRKPAGACAQVTIIPAGSLVNLDAPFFSPQNLNLQFLDSITAARKDRSKSWGRCRETANNMIRSFEKQF